MKHKNKIYIFLTLIVIGGAIMKISHISYAEIILGLGLIGSILYQSWYISKLEKKIEELERK